MVQPKKKKKTEINRKTSNIHGLEDLRGQYWDFPGGAVVKTPPANSGDTGLIPGPGRSHMPQSN